jgi:hypothetical protein
MGMAVISHARCAPLPQAGGAARLASSFASRSGVGSVAPPLAHPAAARQQAAKPRCPSRLREGMEARPC